MRRVHVLIGCLFLFLAPGLRAQTPAPQIRTKSCHDFVQGFYDWYVHETFRTLKDGEGADAYGQVLKNRGAAFSPGLLRALREDQEAQAKVSGEIVGLDFDPFLASQDPSKHFVVGKITFKGNQCFADVHGTSYGTNGEHVLPELTRKNGRWVFVNFHYPDFSPDENLIDLLKMLKADREKSSK